MTAQHPPWPHLGLDTAVGRFRLYADENGALARIAAEDPAAPTPRERERPHPAALDRAAAQLAEYFLGTRRRFELPLGPGLGRFPADAAAVWRRITAVPYGHTITPERLAQPSDRAAPGRIALIVGANPLAIVVPCHRVVWDAESRRPRPTPLHQQLLAHEREVIARSGARH